MKRYKRTLVCTIATALLLAGCLGADEDPSPGVPAVDLEEEMPLPEVHSHESFIELGFGTPLISFNQGSEDTYNIPLPVTDNTTGIVLELHWTAESPLTENLDLWIRDASKGAVPPEDPMDLLDNQPHMKTSGSSPLRLDIDVGDLEDGVDYSILMRASSEPAGIAIDQSFTLYMVLFEDLEFDAGYEIEV